MQLQLPRVIIQLLLLPILALVLPLIYLVAWLREAMDDRAFARAPVPVAVRRLPDPRTRRND
jgi:hypothetical protein